MAEPGAIMTPHTGLSDGRNPVREAQFGAGMGATAPSRWNPRARGALRAVIRADRAANDAAGTSGLLKPGVQALIVYRFGQWALARRRRGLLAGLAEKLYWALFASVRNSTGIELVATATVGRNPRIEHQSGIVVHPFAVIGDDVQIHHGVTIGALRNQSELADIKTNPPRVGARVVFGVGSIVLSGVTIGDDARIGPNAVVAKDVPRGATVVAMPSRTLQLGRHDD